MIKPKASRNTTPRVKISIERYRNEGAVNIKFVRLACIALATFSLGSQGVQASPVLTSYTEASASGPFDNAFIAPSANSLASATSPDHTIYYDRSVGYNAVGGEVSQIGGATASADTTVGQLRAGAGTTLTVNGF